MVDELYFYRLLIILAGFLSIGLCFFSYVKLKNVPAARQYTFVTMFSAIFTFSYAFELSATTLKEIKFWLGIEYIVMPFIPGFILLMCLEYIGIKLRQRNIFILFGIPLITVFMHHTNELHHLYYASVGLLATAPFPIIDLEYGPFFYLHSLYLFICVSVGIIILLLQLKKSQFQFRIQLLTMVAGLLVPIIANSFYLNDLSPYGIDLGPVSMSISFALHGIALFSFQMFNVIPIARERVFDNMLEGVIVLDQNDHIVDFNKATLHVMPFLSSFSIGKAIHIVLNEHNNLAELISRGEECEYESIIEGRTEYHQVRFSKILNSKGVPISKIITFVNITERVEMQRQLRELANFDGLTKVSNRRYFMDQSVAILESIKKKERNVSLIMFDIDHFKSINDTYGHEAGDLVLTEVAKLVKSSLRQQDILGRYGGEEFIILLPEMDLNSAFELANTIRLIIKDAPISINDTCIHVMASFGVASIQITPLDQGESFKQALRNVDQALYAAKRNGRNNVQVYTEKIQLV